MIELPFQQVDVFSSEAFKGNPVAVVFDADGLSDNQMADIAKWTNLSETTYVLKSNNPNADYRLRIFTQIGELPFAGHPTLGACHAWLQYGGRAKDEKIIQECGLGLVPIRHENERLAFAAPELLRSGPVDEAIVADIARGLRIDRDAILGIEWADNGPGWVALRLRSRAAVLALDPDFVALGKYMVGVVGPWDLIADGDEAQFEVRAFAPGAGITEDPVTGSLNAALAQWLIRAGHAKPTYVASQGAALGRSGMIHVQKIDADIWIGGDTKTVIDGVISVETNFSL